MRISILLLAASLTGCFVVPSKTTTTKSLGNERSASRPGVSRGLSLSTSVERDRIIVQTIRKRDCKQEVFRVTEITEHRGLRMGGVEDPRGAWIGAILAPVTLPISLVVSSLSLAGNRTHTHQVRTPIAVETSPCEAPGKNVRVDIALASGEQLSRQTDDDGRLVFQLPPGEPYRGVVTVRAELEVSTIKYHRKSPALTTVRDAVTSCAGTQAFTGPLEVSVAVDRTGVPTRFFLAPDNSALAECLTPQIAQARFPEAQRDTTLSLSFSLGE